MKKILCFILILSLVMIFGSASFAATGGTDIPNNGVPGGAITTETDAYTAELPNENIAGGSVDTTKGGALNEVVPGGGVLPKTGGIPAETFYAAGALIVLVALILSRKKVKTSSGNK